MTDDGPVVIQRVRDLVDPIASDLGLDLYDVEQRGDTLRVTLDTRPGRPSGVDLDTLALATRLISRELDHDDPVPGHYTLEVTSPGVERYLRTPAHFQREIGKTVNVRLADVGHEQRRLEGVLVAADDSSATIQVADPTAVRAGRPRHRPTTRSTAPARCSCGVRKPKPGGPKRRGASTGTPTTTPARAEPVEPTPTIQQEKQSS